MVSPAMQYTSEYFYQKKTKYYSLLSKKNARSNILLSLVKKNLIGCAKHLAEYNEDVDAIYWICEKFSEGDPDILMSEKEFKKYIKINTLKNNHLPSMELLAKYYLKDDGNGDVGSGSRKPCVFKKGTDVKIYGKDFKHEKSDPPENKDDNVEKSDTVNNSSKKAPLSLKDEINEKRKAATDIQKKDMPFITREKVDELLRPFDDLIGLEGVKTQLKHFSYNMIAESKRRKYAIDADHKQTLHMVFSGNPGTGKTTVARMLGSVLKELGYLTSGHVHEVDRSDLVGCYIGHTEYHTSQAIKDAMGGVLFIDEAYSMNKGFDWDFGAEAMELIIKEMEDSRDNLVVIFAGYPREMEWFVNMNPGLQSRIATTLDFPDYSNEELTLIFKKYIDDINFKINPLALDKMMVLFKNMSVNERQKFGNARGVRNIFEKTLQGQSLRIVEQDIDDREGLVTILAQDIAYEKKNKKRGKVATVLPLNDN